MDVQEFHRWTARNLQTFISHIYIRVMFQLQYVQKQFQQNLRKLDNERNL
jgi:hypothetical protein